MNKSNMKSVTVATLGAIGWLLLSAAPADAFTWWNPLTWFESSEAVKAEIAQYKAERPGYEETVEEAWMTEDFETFQQARKELLDFDKEHERRLREIRKKERAEMKHPHKERKSAPLETAKDRRAGQHAYDNYDYYGFVGERKNGRK